MIVEVNYKEIQSIINKYCPDNPVTEAEAIEAFHNLVGFVNLLIQIDNTGLVRFNHKTGEFIDSSSSF